MSAMFFVLLLAVLSSSSSNSAAACSKNTTLAGLESDLFMVQHQLRGVINITDACSFSVRNFDMIPGSDAVLWWGADGEDFHNLTAGYAISSLALNRTYRNETLTVPLLPNITFDQIQVISVWDQATASDFGHVALKTLEEAKSSDLDLAPAPSPSSDSTVNRQRKKLIHRAPTMLDNCRTISPSYRLRWTLNSDSISIALEAAVESQYYLAFGWANPKLNSVSMIGADVTVAGFTEEATPFAEDYYITSYSECQLNEDGKVEGVCPDTIYEASDPVGLVNNTKLGYGHRRDGVSFIRFDRPLHSQDSKYDVSVEKTANMTVVWALGKIRPPDTLRSYYLPQNHGGPRFSSFGYFNLNVSEDFDDCLGPLDAEDKEDQGIIISDGKEPVVVTTGPALHYPNPPNPSKVLYINKKETPLLRVERGVPVTFSIQAGHDVAFYITSDPIGGNATSRNVSEVIYAGGEDAHGVR